jgi:cytidine deaminase
MKKITLSIEISETCDIDDLSNEDRDLISDALAAAATSWSPYSGFSVGAAVKLADGTIVKGSNIENASFPSGICAEHNALSAAATGNPESEPVAMAVIALNKGIPVQLPVAPCGKCRQIIAETETRYGKPVRLILAGQEKIIIVESGSSLLPMLFSKKDLAAGDH